jgi:hypothetical protein
MKKIQNQHKQEPVLYTFRYDQVVTGDVRGFLEQYDPFRLPSNRIRELFGNLVLGFEGVENAAVSTHPEIRVLLRRLHAIWPWSGYFLNLERPIGPANAINNFPLLGIGLSLSDMVMCRWAKTDQFRIRVGPQLSQYHTTCLRVLYQMGKRAQLPAEAIYARHMPINEQFHHGIIV